MSCGQRAACAGGYERQVLHDQHLHVQEEQERQEAIEELQATFMGHQARQPVVKALQVLCSKLRRKKIDH